MEKPSHDATPAVLEALRLEVDSLLERFPWSLRFTKPVEAIYRVDTCLPRAKTRLLTTLLGLLFSVFSLINIATLAPDRLAVAIPLVLGNAVLWSVTSFLILRQCPPFWIQDSIEVGISFTTVSILSFVNVTAIAPDSVHMVYGIIIAIIYPNVINRIRPEFAIPITLWCIASVIFTVTHQSAFPAAAYGTAISQIAMLALATSVANYLLEKYTRRTYLVSLKSELREKLLHVANIELDRISRLDPLTGLANRREMDRYLGEAAERAQLNGSGIAALLIDVDHFKYFNDQYGHLEGDACLQAVAGIVRDCAPEGQSLAARYGGEEFVVLLSDAALDEARLLAERIRRAIRSVQIPHERSNFKVVTVSIGLHSIAGRECRFASDLLKGADQALYEAKRAGRDRIAPSFLVDVSDLDAISRV